MSLKDVLKLVFFPTLVVLHLLLVPAALLLDWRECVLCRRLKPSAFPER